VARSGEGGETYILFLGRFSPENEEGNGEGMPPWSKATEKTRAPIFVKTGVAGASSYCDEDTAANYVPTRAEQIKKILEWVSGREGWEELITQRPCFVLPSDREGLSLALLDCDGPGLWC